MKLFLKHARDKVCIYRSLKVGVVVGTLLALINHYNAILSGALTATVIFQILIDLSRALRCCSLRFCYAGKTY